MNKFNDRKSMDVFRKGDLVAHNTILSTKNKGYGIIVDILPIEYSKIDTINVLWYDGTKSWVNRFQLEIRARGQGGEYS